MEDGASGTALGAATRLMIKFVGGNFRRQGRRSGPACLTSLEAERSFQQQYLKAFQSDAKPQLPALR